MFKFHTLFNVRASYIDQNEVAQIRINTIAVWNEVILKYLFPHLPTILHFDMRICTSAFLPDLSQTKRCPCQACRFRIEWQMLEFFAY